jgi:hypothetical protein
MAGGNVDDGHHPLAAGEIVTYVTLYSITDFFKLRVVRQPLLLVMP